MNTRYFKIALAVLFVAIVSFFVVRGCVHKKTTVLPPEIPSRVTTPKPPKEAQIPPIAANTPIPAAPARMAIILDDWGNNFSLTKDAIAVGRPLTLSILPNLPQSKRIAEEAFNNHLGVMLHMPMQPKSKKQPLEPHTIMTTTLDKTIVRYLDAALLSVPHAEGVNNHQGSAATSDLRVMRTVLKHLKEKGLFFVDSDVAASTVGPQVAKEVSIPFTKRNVFIDNIAKVDNIKIELKAAERIALSKGRVVVIGHDKKATLQAIREMVPEFEKNGIKLVLVKELVG